MKASQLLSAALVLSSLLSSCDRNESVSKPSSRLQVRLTDDPAAFDKVNIDIREIHVNFNGDSANGWQVLPGVRAGVYNLLDLVNDKDTLLADAMIPSGRIQQMRLVLGENNSIEKDGKVYELKTPSAMQSGLKFNIHQDLDEGLMYVLLMDFDAGRSVTRTGNGNYVLKPVIRTVLNAAGGSIRSVVMPDSVRTFVYALKGSDTIAGTATSSNGSFLINGLAAGTYNLSLVPTDTFYISSKIEGVQVNIGQVTSMDTIKLAK